MEAEIHVHDIDRNSFFDEQILQGQIRPWLALKKNTKLVSQPFFRCSSENTITSDLVLAMARNPSDRKSSQLVRPPNTPAPANGTWRARQLRTRCKLMGEGARAEGRGRANSRLGDLALPRGIGFD